MEEEIRTREATTKKVDSGIPISRAVVPVLKPYLKARVLRKAVDWLNMTKLASRALRVLPVYKAWFYLDADLQAPPHWRREVIWALHFAKAMTNLEEVGGMQSLLCIRKGDLGFGSGDYGMTSRAPKCGRCGAPWQQASGRAEAVEIDIVGPTLP
jgi:hypothetical protein